MLANAHISLPIHAPFQCLQQSGDTSYAGESNHTCTLFFIAVAPSCTGAFGVPVSLAGGALVTLSKGRTGGVRAREVGIIDGAGTLPDTMTAADLDIADIDA